MNILITGCAGFIGSHAVDLFLSRGYSVIGVDCLTYAGSINNMEKALNHKNFKWYKNDICDTESIISYCIDHKISWILNFAAETHVDNSIDSIDNFIHSNILGVKSLLEVCRKTDTNIFQVSTDEVYGSVSHGSFSEDSILSPKNPYSATKAAAEHLVTSYSNTHGVKYIIARPSNNFGPRQHREKFIPTILGSLSCGKKIPVYGNGKNIRDWLYVKNNVMIIEKMIRHSQLNEIYNITSCNEMSNIELINKITNILNLDFKSNVTFVNDRLGHDFRYSICDKKIKERGFQVESSFEKDLVDTIKDYS